MSYYESVSDEQPTMVIKAYTRSNTKRDKMKESIKKEIHFYPLL